MPSNTFFQLPLQKRTKIEAAAIDEFARCPHELASVNAIVKTAGIAKGSFYQYFADMQDLYAHILQLIRERKSALLAELNAGPAFLNTFGYLRRILSFSLLFELREPKMAQIERREAFENPKFSEIDPETGLRISGDGRFHALLTQGIHHNDLNPWVDIDIASWMLSWLSQNAAPYIIERLGPHAETLRQNSTMLSTDLQSQALIDSLLEIIEAGMARNPQIRKDYFTKH